MALGAIGVRPYTGCPDDDLGAIPLCGIGNTSGDWSSPHEQFARIRDQGGPKCALYLLSRRGSPFVEIHKLAERVCSIPPIRINSANGAVCRQCPRLRCTSVMTVAV